MNRETASLRPFRYLTIPTDERDRVHVVRETVQCGKPRCRCARGEKHGPYFYLRYEFWDAEAGARTPESGHDACRRGGARVRK